MSYKEVDYGFPESTWQVVTPSNEEDNPILARPLLQDVITTAAVFGWRDQRPDPKSVRDADANPLQPLTMANGRLLNRLVRMTDASYYTHLANRDIGLTEFIDHVFLNTLSRFPADRERILIRDRLRPVWSDRRAVAEARTVVAEQAPPQVVRDQLDAYRYLAKARESEPATRTLSTPFQRAFEEILWMILNSPEFIFVP
jgi:hypothetical protein